MKRKISITDRVKAIFRWPWGLMWVLTAAPVLIWIEISLEAEPSYFWPIAIVLIMRLIWLWTSGEWIVAPCDYGRCQDKRKKTGNGRYWAIVQGKEILICKNCYKYIHSERSMDHVIRQHDDF